MFPRALAEPSLLPTRREAVPFTMGDMVRLLSDAQHEPCPCWVSPCTYLPPALSQVQYPPPPPPSSRQPLAPIAPPVGPPDAAHCQATGPGIGGGTAGEAAPFTVITHDMVRVWLAV